jgi:hypothetical protein
LLALPLVPALIGGVALLMFFYETPSHLLIKNNDKQAATKGG